jgi:hypothetical protein
MEQGLMHPAGIGIDDAFGVGRLDADADRLGQGAPDEALELAQKPQQIHRPTLDDQLAPEIEDLLGELSRPVGLFDDDPDAVAACVREPLLRQQYFAEQNDRPDDIVEVVGDASRQLADGRQALLQLGAALIFPLGGGVIEDPLQGLHLGDCLWR